MGDRLGIRVKSKGHQKRKRTQVILRKFIDIWHVAV